MALRARTLSNGFIGGRSCCKSFNFSKASAISFSVKATISDSSKSMKDSKSPEKRGKVFASITEAVNDIPNGAKLLIGGFGPSGVPENLLTTIREKSRSRDFTIVVNNPGAPNSAIGRLLKDRRIRRMINSYMGENTECQKQYMRGELELELTPQGTLVERVRAGGAGIPAFYTATGYGTIVQQGKMVVKYDKSGNVEIFGPPKDVREFNGTKYLLEPAITGDFALVKAWKADEAGNLIFRKAARNFNPVMCKAGRVSIVEAEEIVGVGQLDPDEIHLPGIYVDRVVQAPTCHEPFDCYPSNEPMKVTSAMNRIIRRTVRELKNGMYVNVGIGIPTMVADAVPKDINVTLHSENGILGVGPKPPDAQLDRDLINAGKQLVSMLPGASVMSSDESFTMIRGGHIDLSILGALQVSRKGDLANWSIPGIMAAGMGGAMDLVSATRTKVIVTMRHFGKDKSPKILESCTIPLTGQHCVDLIITDLAVFEVEKGKGLTLVEIAPGVDVAQITSSTGCEFTISNDLKLMLQ